MTEAEFTAALEEIGAEAYLVGGWVRDYLRGAAAKDRDYLICGCIEDDFCRLFPEALKVGKSFPVYLLDIDGEDCEVAFARHEKKKGQGYRGFEVVYGPDVTVEEDLFRRDSTMNSLAMKLPDRILIDPYGGKADLEAGQIRAVSNHFCDDPVRALRAARQAAELGFEITPETYHYMEACREELAFEPQERIMEEMKKALASPKPSSFFRALQQAGLLKTIFPELEALIGKIQPEAFHPEGDAFEHTMLIVDEVAVAVSGLAARFAGLAHDLGKGTTPFSMLPHHYGHEQRGLEVLEAWNRRMTLPKEWLKAARFVISEHMRAPRLEKSAKMAKLLLSVKKSGLSMEEFKAVIRADHRSLPLFLEKGEELLADMESVSGNEAPEHLNEKAVGEWLLARQISVMRASLMSYK